jgi:hypothetical protein
VRCGRLHHIGRRDLPHSARHDYTPTTSSRFPMVRTTGTVRRKPAHREQVLRYVGHILYALAVWILCVVGFTDERRARPRTASVRSTERPDPGADPTNRLVSDPCRPQRDEAAGAGPPEPDPLGELFVRR